MFRPFRKKTLYLALMALSLLIALACTNTSSDDPAETTTTSVAETTTTINSMLDLPDTGQTESYTETFGEDSDYTINPPAYTDNGDGTITDKVTGLIWQQVGDDTARTWEEAQAYAADLNQAGYDDWRLPTKKELLSIVDYGTYNPAINTTYFPGTNSSYYWSSTTNAGSTGDAWYVNFGGGHVGYSDKSGNVYVRCVRGGE